MFRRLERGSIVCAESWYGQKVSCLGCSLESCFHTLSVNFSIQEIRPYILSPFISEGCERDLGCLAEASPKHMLILKRVREETDTMRDSIVLCHMSGFWEDLGGRVIMSCLCLVVGQ